MDNKPKKGYMVKSRCNCRTVYQTVDENGWFDVSPKQCIHCHYEIMREMVSTISAQHAHSLREIVAHFRKKMVEYAEKKAESTETIPIVSTRGDVLTISYCDDLLEALSDG